VFSPDREKDRLARDGFWTVIPFRFHSVVHTKRDWKSIIRNGCDSVVWVPRVEDYRDEGSSSGGTCDWDRQEVILAE
jgi:hypothetical protein